MSKKTSIPYSGGAKAALLSRGVDRAIAWLRRR